MIPKNVLKVAGVGVVFFMLMTGVHAAEIEGVFFADSFTTATHRLTIRGTGLFRYLAFVKAYVGALYVDEGKPTHEVLSDTARRLELEYFHPIKGEDFGSATNKVIGQNVDAETLERLRPLIDKLNALYEDVQPGDRYSLTYTPGKGTELALNGQVKGLIEGADLSFAVFAMWLGEKPMNKSFRQQLMGNQ
jgi:hypothetical protein